MPSDISFLESIYNSTSRIRMWCMYAISIAPYSNGGDWELWPMFILGGVAVGVTMQVPGDILGQLSDSLADMCDYLTLSDVVYDWFGKMIILLIDRLLIHHFRYLVHLWQLMLARCIFCSMSLLAINRSTDRVGDLTWQRRMICWRFNLLTPKILKNKTVLTV